MEFLEKKRQIFVSYSETIVAWSCLTSCTLGLREKREELGKLAEQELRLT